MFKNMLYNFYNQMKLQNYIENRLLSANCRYKRFSSYPNELYIEDIKGRVLNVPL